jgi:hypothetical protein
MTTKNNQKRSQPFTYPVPYETWIQSLSSNQGQIGDFLRGFRNDSTDNMVIGSSVIGTTNQYPNSGKLKIKKVHKT